MNPSVLTHEVYGVDYTALHTATQYHEAAFTILLTRTFSITECDLHTTKVFLNQDSEPYQDLFLCSISIFSCSFLFLFFLFFFFFFFFFFSLLELLASSSFRNFYIFLLLFLLPKHITKDSKPFP